MAKRREIRNSTAEFLIFQIEGKEQGVEVYYKDKTVWCTQKAMGMLFDCTSDNISVHLQNIYDTDELKKEATTEKISVVRREGNRDVNRTLQFYNLDAVISVGYRVNSIDLVDQQRNTVNTLSLDNTLTLSYKLGNHSLSFKNTTLWQRYTSQRTDFETQQPLTLTNALTALLKLPWKLEISTDLTLYSRTGYADDALNTTDLVWNARLSRPFLKGKFLLMFDGFDLLSQLSNVTRTLNAQGRTETYTNVLPRYALLHVVYRLNKQPKKKVQ